MAWVYILQGATGRHYIGSTVDLDARFAQHLRGHTATTRRLGGELRIVAKKEMETLQQARKVERFLKSKKKIQRSQYSILREDRAAPKAFGVGREFDSPLWQILERKAGERRRRGGLQPGVKRSETPGSDVANDQTP
jgi:predicted GIY-YIG superfamily endonuclease